MRGKHEVHTLHNIDQQCEKDPPRPPEWAVLTFTLNPTLLIPMPAFLNDRMAEGGTTLRRTP